MELANFDLKSSLLSQDHLESYQQNKKIVRSYEEIIDSEVNRVNPILRGHTSGVVGAALTSDNSFIISAGRDNTVRVWSLIDRVQEQKYVVEVGPEDSLTDMVMSSDDKFIVFNVSSSYVIVWSLETQKETAKVPKKEKVDIWYISISSDNSMFCVVENESELKVYDLAGNLLKSFQPEGSKIHCIAFAHKMIFIGIPENKVIGWNLQTSAIDFSQNFDSSPTSLLLFENNRNLAIGFSNKELVVWDLLETSNEFKLPIDHGCINKISYSSSTDNKTLVCSTDDRKVVFVDLVNKSIKRYFIRHTESITSVAQTKDGKLVITASDDKLIKIWQHGEYRDFKVSNRFGKSIKISALDRPSDLFAVAYKDLTVKLFNLAHDKEIYSLGWKGQNVNAATWSHDKRHIITVNSTNEILVFSYENKSIEYSIPLDVQIFNIVISPDSKYLYGCNGEDSIYVWSLHDKKLDHVFVEKQTLHYVLAFNQDWTKMYSGACDAIFVWDIATKTIDYKFQGISLVKCLVLLANQKTLISGGNDGKIVFWDLEEKKLDTCIEEGYSWARSMELFSDEKFLVVVHDTQKITVINVIEKRIEYEFDGPGAQLCCKMLNETTLIMGDSQYIRFINLPEKKEEYSIKAHNSNINAILLDTDKDTLISFSSDKTIKSYKISDKSEQISYQTYCGMIISLSLSRDYLALGSEEGLVNIFYTYSSSDNKTIPVHNGAINSIDIYEGNFATGSNDTKVALFDFNSKEPFYFEGHTGNVRVVKFSNDGKYVFSGADDKKIKFWNIEKKNLVFDFLGHENIILSLFVFPTKKILASGSADKSVRLWNLDLRKEVASFENHSGNVLSLTTSDDEELIISGSDDLSIAVTNVETKKLVCMMTGHTSSVLDLKIYNNILYSTDENEVKNWMIDEKKEIFSLKSKLDYPVYIALSLDERYLAASFSEGLIRIYDFKYSKFLEPFQPFSSDVVPRIEFTFDSKNILISIPDNAILIWNISQKKSHEIPGSKPNARNLKFSYDHSLIATFSNENKVCIWNWVQKKLIYSLEGHSALVQAMVFSRDNKYLFTGGEDNLIIKFDLESKEIEKDKLVFSDHTSTVRALAFANNKNILVSGGQERKIFFFDTAKNELSKSQDTNGVILTIAITDNEIYAISAGEERSLCVWNIDKREVDFRIEGHTNYISSIVVSKDNDHVYSGATDKIMWVWSLNERKKMKYLRSVFGTIYCIALNREGTIAYVGSDENNVNVFDIGNKTEITCMFGHTRTVCDIALSEDETILVSGSWDCTARVFNAKTSEELALLKDGHSDYVRSVAITRDKKYVISGSDDARIILWNLENKGKEKEFILEGHRAYIMSVRLTPDEKYLISGSRDQTIKLWDFTKKIELYSFNGHTAPISCLELMNNSMTFLSGGEDGLIKAWSIDSKREEYTLNGHTQVINSMKLTSDNLRLVSGARDCKVYIWDLEKRSIELSLGGYSSPVFAVNITVEGSLLLTSGNDNVLKLWKMREPSLVKDQTCSFKPFISVYTPDDKFELTYLYGRLNEVVEINSSSKKIELGITDTYDPYYQSLIPFYNLIDNIRGGQFNTFLPDMSTLVFSRFSYTTIHILAYLGYSKVLKELLDDNASIKTDYFGKSPLYYAINKQKQECVDNILEFLVHQSESNDKSRIHTSFGAIANDLSMIIKNSSKGLHLLLKSCLIPTESTFAKVTEELPIYMYNTNFLPIAKDFTQGKTENNDELIPIIMKYTPFTLPSNMGSKDCINILESIIECSNTSIYNTHLVQYVLQIQWDNLQMWVLGYTFMLWLNLILLVVLFTIDKIGETWVLPIFLLSNFLLITWESIQMYMGGIIEYFKDTWNRIDFLRFTLTMIWVVWNLSTDDKFLEYRILAWLVALLNFIRGLTGFRVFDGTRYYVRLILRALGDMGYFFIMLGYSTITFGVMFQLSRANTVFDFKTLWMDSYSLNFGNFEAQEQYQFSFETLAYMLATIVNVILMLNLLISILGDSYSNFQTDKVFIDYSEKASVILEIQKMFFWVGIEKEYKYFHVMCSSAAADEDETIDERITGIENNLESLREDFKSHSNATSNKFSDRLDVLENKFNDKIGQLETNFQKKLDNVNDTMNKILEFVKPKVEEKKVEEAKVV